MPQKLIVATDPINRSVALDAIPPSDADDRSTENNSFLDDCLNGWFIA